MHTAVPVVFLGVLAACALALPAVEQQAPAALAENQNDNLETTTDLISNGQENLDGEESRWGYGGWGGRGWGYGGGWGGGWGGRGYGHGWGGRGYGHGWGGRGWGYGGGWGGGWGGGYGWGR